MFAICNPQKSPHMNRIFVLLLNLKKVSILENN